MHLIQKKIAALMGYFFLTALILPSVQAYVLQGPHILELMIAELGKADSLFVSQKIIFYKIELPEEQAPAATETNAVEPEADLVEKMPLILPMESSEIELRTREVELHGTLRYLFPRAFRAEISSEDSQRVYLFAQGEALTVIDDHLSAVSETRFDLYKDLMLFRSRETLVDRLWDLGVDVSVSSLGRFEGQVAFVVGGQYPDESVSQVWFDKETFRPLRWIIHSAGGDYDREPLEIRYLEWWEKENLWYPMRIEFFQKKRLVQVIVVEKLEVNKNFPKELFEIRNLKARYPLAPSTAGGPDKTGEPSEIQKTIQEFRKIFE